MNIMTNFHSKFDLENLTNNANKKHENEQDFLIKSFHKIHPPYFVNANCQYHPPMKNPQGFKLQAR